jgi:hypothetical protein
MEITVAATPKFFKRKMPETKLMELHTIHAISANEARIFLRDLDDSDYPNRVGIILTASACEQLAAELTSLAAEIRRRSD